MRLRQPARGYRVAIDPVFLAAAVPANPGDSVLDIGAGTGAAALCLAHRVRRVRVTGIEVQPALAALARQSAAYNRCEDRVRFVEGNIGETKRPLLGRFDHVMANPPYRQAGRAQWSREASRATAHHEESAVPIAAWVDFAFAHLRVGGSATFIYASEREDDLIAQIHRHTSAIQVTRLWPKTGRPAKRVIVRAARGTLGAERRSKGLVLHELDGTYTKAAQAILRGGAALP